MFRFGKCFPLAFKLIPGLIMRMIGDCEQNHLRVWKNQSRQPFFFRDLIVPAAQSALLEKYLGREHDPDVHRC